MFFLKQLIIILFFIAAIACTRQAPQLPANKNLTVDSVNLAIQAANQRLIEGEDSVLEAYVQQKKLNVVKTNSGLWLRIQKKTDGPELKDFESCRIKYRVFSLNDSLLKEKTETIVFGKKQVINGIEEALHKLNKGDEALLIVPWYLGYGMKGDGSQIPPYTSLVVNLYLFD